MSSITDTPATTVSRARSHTPVVDASRSLPPAPATAVPVTAGPETVVHIPAATTRSAWARPLRAAANIGQRLIAIGVLVAIWEIFPRLGVVDATFLPPLSEVLAAWWGLLTSGELAAHVEASLMRSLAGLGLAITAAVPLGLLIGWYKTVATLLNPLLEVFRNTAALALLPVFVLILGLGEVSKISIVFYACSWPILLNTISGVQGVDPLLIKSARSLGLPAPRLFQKVILPAAVPTIFTGIRLAGAYAILILIAAEMVGAKAGLGYLINYAQFNFAVPDMYAGIITISGIGLVINQVLLQVECRFSTWRTSAGG